MNLIYTASGERWRGERIDGKSYPWLKQPELWQPERLEPLGLETREDVVPDVAPMDIFAAINAERDRRIASGCEFAGHTYQTDFRSLLRIAGATQMATLAILNGAEANDLRWHGGPTDFEFTTAFNERVLMDALTMIELGKAVGVREKLVLDKARSLKDSPGGPPADWANDIYWT